MEQNKEYIDSIVLREREANSKNIAFSIILFFLRE